MRPTSESYDRDRYLLGYRGQWPDVRWPNDARVAVSIVVNVEEGAEASVASGDPVGERAAELASSLPSGIPDLAMDQHFAYGLRAGYWRVIDALTHHRQPATFLVCGRAAERASFLVQHAAQLGHEIACHSYRWSNHALFESAQTEEQEIQRAIDALLSVGCKRPVGFYSRWGPSVNTRRILHCLGFEYDSNAYDDDVPYYAPVGGGASMLVLPYALDTNDWKFFEGDPWGTGRAYLEYLTSSLDLLIEEGSRGHVRMMTIGLHLRIMGRPGRACALRRFLEYLHGLGDKVWVARRADISAHWRATVSPDRTC